MEFHATGNISYGCGSSFITLIPKVGSSVGLRDYRPITLVGVVSKMGFHPLWCEWVKGICYSSRAAVLVNGSPTFDFRCEKGLRQGDPLSPFLFFIVMEALSWLLKKAKTIGAFKGISFADDDEEDLTHLFYADDALILGEWSRDNITSVARILRIFYLCSGLRINLHKSNIFGVGVDDHEVDSMMDLLGCKRGDGSSLNFWSDRWLREAPLRVVYPHLFRLERCKWVSVSQRVVLENNTKVLHWDWRAAPSTHEEISELYSLLNDIYEFQWRGGQDRWTWSPEKDGMFSVSSANKLLANYVASANNYMIDWKSWVPLKCKISVWRAARNRLPTIAELIKRGVPIQDSNCVFCQGEMKTSLHLFIGCALSQEVWSRVERWCRLRQGFAFDVLDFLQLPDTQVSSKTTGYILRGIV
ncbi:uncharacterized protein LOC110890798 [Helianthus annuus]|uniref:uncharacterized protein LOC110890798 n=1 Tax=Helianthus annuus TaxID=4232 RepID=UPI000B8EEFDA|nr:uncharacterized protein LOC110890798 [Helianthus annuus]